MLAERNRREQLIAASEEAVRRRARAARAALRAAAAARSASSTRERDARDRRTSRGDPRGATRRPSSSAGWPPRSSGAARRPTRARMPGAARSCGPRSLAEQAAARAGRARARASGRLRSSSCTHRSMRDATARAGGLRADGDARRRLGGDRRAPAEFDAALAADRAGRRARGGAPAWLRTARGGPAEPAARRQRGAHRARGRRAALTGPVHRSRAGPRALRRRAPARGEPRHGAAARR